MAVNDPVADFLTRIRNGVKAQHRYIDVSWSKMKESISNILKDFGFVEGFLVKKDAPQRGTIRIFLKYGTERNPVISGLKRVSRPGLRKYVSYQEIPSFYGGFGLSIVSTSQGIFAGNQARDKKIGGELLCLVW